MYIESPTKVDIFLPLFVKKFLGFVIKFKSFLQFIINFLDVGKLQISFFTIAICAAAISRMRGCP